MISLEFALGYLMKSIFIVQFKPYEKNRNHDIVKLVTRYCRNEPDGVKTKGMYRLGCGSSFLGTTYLYLVFKVRC